MIRKYCLKKCDNYGELVEIYAKLLYNHRYIAVLKKEKVYDDK